jgi:3-hydroxybutyryl-CoA dehydratase
MVSLILLSMLLLKVLEKGNYPENMDLSLEGFVDSMVISVYSLSDIVKRTCNMMKGIKVMEKELTGLMQKELTYEEIQVGDSAVFSKTISEFDIYAFAGITGDFNPMHINEEFADTTIFRDRIAHGLLTGSFISTVLGMKLPGPNSIYLSQSFKFTAPVKIGDTISAKVEVIEKQDHKKFIKLKTQVFNQRNEMVVDGEALVMKKVLEDHREM